MGGLLKQRSLLLLVGLFLLLTSLIIPSVQAEDTSPWFAAEPPVLTKVSEKINPNDLPPRLSSNVDCQRREVVLRPARIVPPQTKISHTACAVDTGFGALSESVYWYLQRSGSSIAGRLKTASGGNALMQPVPRINTAVRLVNGPVFGYYLYFYDNVEESLASTQLVNGNVEHRLPQTESAQLRDKAGNLLPAAHDSISFSADGKWMVVDSHNKAVMRVNMVTREVLPFGHSANYGLGQGPHLQTAITPDGRYAAVSSVALQRFWLYDLSTCGSAPDTITTWVSCDSKNLFPFMSQQIPNFRGATRLQFRNNYTLDMVVSTNTDSGTASFQYTLTAAGQEQSGFQYLGMGDSFASGEGAYQYKAITDTADNKCHLSFRSYPYLVASALGFAQSESVACSGAKLQDLKDTSEKYNSDHSQAKGKSATIFDKEILNGFLPGYRAQRVFIEEYQPEVVTISAVGNDIGFSDKIRRCLDTDTCYSSYEDRREIVEEIRGQYYHLSQMYEDLQTDGGPKIRIYAIGYPQIGDPDGNCAANVHLNHDELIFAQQLITYLNSMVKTAAEKSGVFYVDAEDAFAGHRLCETFSWNTALNGLTAGNDILDIPLVHGPIGNESYHPNSQGHELLKTTVLAKTQNLTVPMPAPNRSLQFPEATDTMPLLQNAPKTNRTIRIVKNITGTNGGVIEVTKTQVMRVTGIGAAIKAGGIVKGWLNSEPLFLGDFVVGDGGVVDLELTLPDTVPTGFHTLHLYGTNTSGEELDFYTTVSVVNGEAGPCGIIAASGQDSDKDAVDDACDPDIQQPPTEPDPEEPLPPEEPPAPPTKPTFIEQLLAFITAVISPLFKHKLF